jgi:hypothetical protein
MYGAGDGARPAGIRRASSLSAIPGKVQLRRFGAGLDLHCGELLEPLFWRACLAELVGTTLFLFFTVSSIVYRGLFSLAAVVPGVPTITESNYGSAARSSIAWTFGLAIFVLVRPTPSPHPEPRRPPVLTLSFALASLAART